MMSRSVFGEAVIALAVLAACSWLPAVAEGDIEPPVINVTPPKGVSDEDTLRLEARVTDRGGLAHVVLYAKGEKDDDYRRFDMHEDHNDLWVASLLPWPQRGQRVVFYIEAVDKAGNGPTRAGGPSVPYIVRMLERSGDAGTGGTRSGAIVAMGLFAGMMLFSGFLYSRSKKDARLDLRKREVEFWRSLMEPLHDLPEGAAREAAIAKICAKKHTHPRLGTMMVDPSEVKRRLMATSGGRRRPRAKVVEPQLAMKPRTGDPLKHVEEDIFWFRLLSPLCDMDTLRRDNAMRELGSRPHHHPHQGKHFIDRSTLQQQFQRVREMSPESLQGRLRALKCEAAKRAAEAAAECAATQDDTSPEAATAAPVARESSGPVDDDPLSGRDDSPKTIAEEIFWFNLLARIKDLPESRQEAALGALSGKPHTHPLEGNRLYSTKRLHREFEWIKRADVGALHERWNNATLSALGHEADKGGASEDELREALGDSSSIRDLEDKLDALFDDDSAADRP